MTERENAVAACDLHPGCTGVFSSSGLGRTFPGFAAICRESGGMAQTAAACQQQALNIAVGIRQRVQNGAAIPDAQFQHEIAVALQLLAQSLLGGAYLPATFGIGGYASISGSESILQTVAARQR